MNVKDWIKNTALFRIYCECMIWRIEKKRFLDEINSAEISISEKKAYLRTLRDYRISPSEYFYQYKFYNLAEVERKEFIMRSEMQKVYRRLVLPSVRPYFLYKALFLKTHSDLIKRRWLVANECANIEELIYLITSVDTIVKPIEGSLGTGVYKIRCEDVGDNALKICDALMKDRVLIEECIVATEEIQSFHPSSLNTIRVVTFSNESKAEILGAFIRFGRNGSVVDNAHAGGIFATIDVNTGYVISNGLDTNGNEYTSHPDSQKIIKGFIIPHWNEIKNTCLKATRIVPGLRFAGWDCVVLPNGEIDIVEGHHGPDVDVMQSPLKIGIRGLIESKLKEYFNYTL